MKRDWNDRLQAGERIDPDEPGELLDVVGGEPPAEAAEAVGERTGALLPWRTLGEWCELDGDWLDVAPPPRSWLLTDPYGEGGQANVLSRGVVGIFASAGGVGKTFALLELAALVASGGHQKDHNRLWLDRLAADGGRVLFIAGEETADELRRRLHAVVRRFLKPDPAGTRDADRTRWHPGLKQKIRDRLVVVPTAGVPDLALLTLEPGRNLRPSARHAEIVDKLREGPEPWDLVILDPMVRFAAGEIDRDNMAASALIGSFEAFIAAGARPGHPGPAVLVAHHTSKQARRDGPSQDTSADVRGASAITDNARWCATLGPHPDKEAVVVFTVSKSNYGGKPCFSLARDESGLLRLLTRKESADLDAAIKAAKDAARDARLEDSLDASDAKARKKEERRAAGVDAASRQAPR
jgi:hypothetical protein